VIESEGLHHVTCMLHINELVLFVHAVDAAHVLICPRDSQVEPLITELDRVNSGRFGRFLINRTLQLNGLLLCPNIVNDNLSILESNTQHEPIRMKLNCRNRRVYFHLSQQLTQFEIMKRPTTVITANHNEITNRLE